MLSIRSNVAPADPKTLAFMRELALATAVTPDMVQRGVIAYHNYLATRESFDPHDMVEEILRAALSGDGTHEVS